MPKARTPLDRIVCNPANGVALGTLASHGVQELFSMNALEEDFYMKLAKLHVNLAGLTTGEGPLVLYLACGELSTTEVKEFFDLDNVPIDRNDRDSKEKASRPIWVLNSRAASGMFSDPGGASPPVTWPPSGMKGWTFSDGEGWAVGVYNAYDLALTTGAEIHAWGEFFGRFLQ